MSAKEVQDKVIEGFKDLGISGFKFLIAGKDNSLALTEKQIMSGDSVITVAGSGSLYLQEFCLMSGSDSDKEPVKDIAEMQKVCLID